MVGQVTFAPAGADGIARLCIDNPDKLNALTVAMWRELRAAFSEEAMLELLLLAGFYRTVSYLANALRLPLEPDAARFPPPYIEASSIAR